MDGANSQLGNISVVLTPLVMERHLHTWLKNPVVVLVIVELSPACERKEVLVGMLESTLSYDEFQGKDEMI